MNLLKRDLLASYLDVTPNVNLACVLANRLDTSQAKIFRGSSLATQELSGLGSLPIMRHQPRDVGKYMTSFVGSLIDPDTNSVNLGFYRILVIAEDRAVIHSRPSTNFLNNNLAALADIRDAFPIISRHYQHRNRSLLRLCRRRKWHTCNFGNWRDN